MNKPQPGILRISKGNLKLPKSTYTFNMTSVWDCPSLALGLCSLGVSKKCYSMKPYRKSEGHTRVAAAQALYWTLCSAEDFVRDILRISGNSRKNGLKQLRFNESGDFRTQACVKKADRIAELLLEENVRTYTYTHRRDLDLSCRHLVVNASSEEGTDDWGLERGLNVFKCVSSPGENAKVCPGDCRKCSICSVKHGKVIEVVLH